MPASPIPSIEISLAPADPLPVEPYSPFDTIAFPGSEQEDDGPRANRLTLPVLGSPMRNSPTNPSPLGRSSSAKQGGRGLDQERFQNLLRSATQRAAPGLDLRKQVALKVHKSKQADRRAIFLSKIVQPPSPSATSVPVTPPESPAVLHYSLPSPGLESPISLFETLALVEGPQKKKQGWVEHVDFNAPPPSKKAAAAQPPKSPLPSLDQISQRSMQRKASKTNMTRLPIGRPVVHAPAARAPIPLPAFLNARPRTDSTPASPLVSPAAPARLPLPALPPTVRFTVTPPPAPHPRFNVSTTVLPAPQLRSRTVSSGSSLTAENLSLLASRNEKGKAMLEKILRRVSAPAELERPGRRHGVEHPVLAMPGGF
ncbi:hypothetical protein AURDEDRAFT_137083 [Auricularia subglabra TFB-10046 SS5]|nr:hypothetical protein AURDEDRAFT_137083 [Auricularia subglabra TFB-10046 SS5]